MGYAGEESPEKRADIIDYLHTLADNPEPLPKP
jgi:cytochrome c